MQCPKCSHIQSDQQVECLRCGIIFAKYRRQQIDTRPPKQLPEEFADRKTRFGDIIKEVIFYVKPDTNPLIFAGRIIFFLVIFIWGLKFIVTPLESNYAGESLWHYVNLPFHEAGHIIFRPLGRFMTSLGGSLAQLMMPFICLVAFLVKTRDTFAASFCLWWVGQNFIDMAPYINDARSLTLPLLGGNIGRHSPYGFHDWEFILKESGLIRYDHFLADLSHSLGAVLMIFAFVWGGYILFGQSKNL